MSPGPTASHSTALSPALHPLVLAALLTAFLLLATQGLGNHLFAGGGAVVWKQALVLLCCGLIAPVLRSEEYLPALAVIAAILILCLNTIVAGATLGKALYNAFFYVSWLPFYLIGQRLDATRRIKWIATFIILASVVGLWVEFATPYLDVLKDDDAALRDERGDDQRLAFVFSFSTGVMPVLAVFFCLALIAGAGAWLALALLICLAGCVIPTGSLAAVLMLVACIAMTWAVLGWRSRLGAIAIAVGLVIAGAALLPRTNRIDIQVERIFGNDGGSDSNLGRMRLWREALAVTAEASVPQLLLGRGLGSTNDDQFGPAAFGHGESSLFQAMIEGGLLGLALRVAPLALLFAAAFRHPRHGMLLCFLAGEVVACAVAPIFGTFGVQCGIALVAGMALRHARAAQVLAQPAGWARTGRVGAIGDGPPVRSAA